MRFDEFKEQLIARLQGYWTQLQESNIYTELKEKYENFTPTVQKLIVAGTLTFTVLIFLFFPAVSLINSFDSMSTFEENKETLRSLLRLAREQAQAPSVPPAPSPAEIQSQVAQALTSVGLATDQIKQNEEANFSADPATDLIPKNVEQSGVQVTVMKLNVKQVIDVAHKLQSIGNVHVLSMDMKANSEDVHYYDVMFRVVGFSVKEVHTPPEKPTETKG